jgi:hypothetical protein
MILHRELDDGDPIVIVVFRVTVLEVEAHEFMVILAQPLLIHVYNLGYFIVVVGVDDLNLGRTMGDNLAEASAVDDKLPWLLHGMAKEEDEEGSGETEEKAGEGRRLGDSSDRHRKNGNCPVEMYPPFVLTG